MDRFGLRIDNADVEGPLDLSALHVPFPLQFRNCVFSDTLTIEGADLHALAVIGRSSLPCLLANGVRIERDLDLSGTTIDGASRTTASTSKTAAVWLTEADVGGRFLCVGTKILGPADRAIQADRTHFGGAVRLIHGFETDGELRLLAIRLDGSLDLTGARLRPKNRRALDLGDAHIGGALFLIDDESAWEGARPEISGRIELAHLSVDAQVLIRNATIRAPQAEEGSHHYNPLTTMRRSAISAPRLSVVGDVIFEGACHIDGGLDLTMAEIKGSLRLDGQAIENPDDRALDLTNAAVGGDVSATALRARGTLYMAGTHIEGSLRLTGSYLSRPCWADRQLLERDSLVVVSAEGVSVDRDVDMRSIVTRGGELWFRGARLGGSVDLTNARLIYWKGHALSLHQAHVAGTVRLAGAFVARGFVAVNHAVIDGRLILSGARLTWLPHHRPSFNRFGAAFEAIGAAINGGLVLGWRQVTGIVDVTGASTSFLADDPAMWGDGARLGGFAYDSFAALPEDQPGGLGNWNVSQRVAWLSRQASFDISPFEQAARVFRQHGRDLEAEDILIHGRRLARQHDRHNAERRSPRGWLRGFGDWFLDRAVGYGYRSGRVGAFILLLTAVTALFVALPPADDALRATDAIGNVYNPNGQRFDDPAGAATDATDPCGDGRVRCFQPIFFSIDTVVPLIDLGQRSTWYPSHHDGAGWLYEIWLNVATILGWVASTVFVLSFARLARST